MEGNPLPFAFNYTFGHILQLAASTFLCGPKRQFKNMFDGTRRETSIVYLSCLVLTLLFVFIPLPVPIIKLIVLLGLMMTQFCASIWYTLSYIPYGRRTFTQCMKRQLGIEDAPSSGYANITMPSIRFGTSSV
jgi:Got1/Sft2-like family